MKLYELNQAAYAKLPTITSTESVHQKVVSFLERNPGKYYMLLNKDKRYYTVYVNKSRDNNKLTEDLLDLAMHDMHGELKEIEDSEDHLEFWIANGDIADMYIFFKYDDGVIEV